tara:strand:+ start:126 stop:434 length:309 start_codon:yes stop_codon:yes gene_type:complete
MKYISIIPLVIFTTLLAKDNTAYIKVDGMMCGYTCEGKVSKVVQNLKGVKECDVDYEKGIATVLYDDKNLEEKDIVQSLKSNSSYKVSLLDDQNNTKENNKI